MIKFSDYFPSLIATDNNSKLAAEMLPFVRSYLDYSEKVYLKTCDITGKRVSEGLKDVWGYSTSYRSNYPKGFQELKDVSFVKPLNEYFLLKSTEFLFKFGYTTEICKKLFICQMFANEMFRGENHPVHRHPRAIVSGVFYLHIPQGSSPIVFHDPRPHIELIGPDENAVFTNTYNIAEIIIKPEVGDIVLFNSWLPHSVPLSTFQVKEGRVAVAFNVNLNNS